MRIASLSRIAHAIRLFAWTSSLAVQNRCDKLDLTGQAPWTSKQQQRSWRLTLGTSTTEIVLRGFRRSLDSCPSTSDPVADDAWTGKITVHGFTSGADLCTFAISDTGLPIKRLHYITGQINTGRPQHRRGLLSVKRKWSSGPVEILRYTNESRRPTLFSRSIRSR